MTRFVLRGGRRTAQPWTAQLCGGAFSQGEMHHGQIWHGVGNRHWAVCPEGDALPGTRRLGQNHGRGVRLHRVSQDTHAAGRRSGRAGRGRIEAVPLAEPGPQRSRGGFRLRAERLGAVHQAAAGGGREDPRYRPLRSPAADSLRPERRDLGLPADGRRQRGIGLRAGNRDRPVRHEARRRLPGARAIRRCGHRSGHRAAFAAGALQLRRIRHATGPAQPRGIRSRRSAGVDRFDFAGHGCDRPRGH